MDPVRARRAHGLTSKGAPVHDIVSEEELRARILAELAEVITLDGGAPDDEFDDE